MTSKPVKELEFKNGKWVRVHRFDPSKKRRIASSKTTRVVSPAKARAAR